MYANPKEIQNIHKKLQNVSNLNELSFDELELIHHLSALDCLTSSALRAIAMLSTQFIVNDLGYDVVQELRMYNSTKEK
jgi:hypothetical protein